MDQSNPRNYIKAEHEYFERIEGYFESSSGSFSEKAYAFALCAAPSAQLLFGARDDLP